MEDLLACLISYAPYIIIGVNIVRLNSLTKKVERLEIELEVRKHENVNQVD